MDAIIKLYIKNLIMMFKNSHGHPWLKGLFIFIFLWIKGDFIVKLRLKCSTFVILVLQKHNHVYIWSCYGFKHTSHLTGVLELHLDIFFLEINDT